MKAPCDVTVVLVAHHSSRLLPAAVTAFRREAAALGLEGEVVVVEQSEDAGEAARAAACAPDLLLVRENRGYAAGINAGVAAARGRWLLLGNPDVELGAGALGALLSALEAGWQVVGPQFELAGAKFPPADVQEPWAELGRRLARGRLGWRRRLRSELSRWRRVWDAEGPQAVPTLSGALLACTASFAARLGPWDEDYFLYFEETDWLRRASAHGGRLAVVPAAPAVHRWGHAARPELMQARFDASRRLYYRRHFPWRARGVLRLPIPPPPPPRDWTQAPGGTGWRWLLSPSPHGAPAALLEDGRHPREAAAELCAASGRQAVTMVAWKPAGNVLAGPFSWSVSASP